MTFIGGIWTKTMFIITVNNVKTCTGDAPTHTSLFTYPQRCPLLLANRTALQPGRFVTSRSGQTYNFIFCVYFHSPFYPISVRAGNIKLVVLEQCALIPLLAQYNTVFTLNANIYSEWHIYIYNHPSFCSWQVVTAYAATHL